MSATAGQPHAFPITLQDSANAGTAKLAPVLEAADFAVTINGGPFVPLASTPMVSPPGSEVVLVTLSADETLAAGAGGFAAVRAVDFDGADGWDGYLWVVDVSADGDARVQVAAAAAIQAQTDNLPVDPADASDVAAAISAAQSAITAAIAALNDLSAAEVNSEVDSGIADAQLATAASITSLAATLATITAALNTATITVIAAVSGTAITVYRNDTWGFTITLTGATLTTYEAVALIVKKSESQADSAALLYVRSDTGLVTIGGATPASSSDGTLSVDSATQFTVTVALTATDVTPGRYTWALKAFDQTPTPDEGYTLATGVFTIADYWLRATA